MAQAEWDDFLMKGGIHLLYVNNRPPGLAPSADEMTALADMRAAYAALTPLEKTYYAGIGGPSFLLKYMQASGGGRATT
jgi:hypothetical protein